MVANLAATDGGGSLSDAKECSIVWWLLETGIEK